MVQPGVDFGAFGSITNERIVGIVAAVFGRDQLGNVTHDRFTNIVQLLTRRPAWISIDKGAKETANVQVYFRSLSRFDLGKKSTTPSMPMGRICVFICVARKAVPGRAGLSTCAQLPPSGKMASTPF